MIAGLLVIEHFGNVRDIIKTEMFDAALAFDYSFRDAAETAEEHKNSPEVINSHDNNIIYRANMVSRSFQLASTALLADLDFEIAKYNLTKAGFKWN